VFVAPLKHVRLSVGITLVTRRVRAAFAYGGDLVTLTRVTADGYGFPSPSGDVEKHDARGGGGAREYPRRRIEDGIETLGLCVPVRVGWLGSGRHVSRAGRLSRAVYGGFARTKGRPRVRKFPRASQRAS
jgi:hypothetical protein